MKSIAAIIVTLLCGLSFQAGVMHGRGELVPLVESKLRALGNAIRSKFSRK